MTTTPVAPMRRTPRAEVRSRLIAAAADVFAELGYADTTLERIASTAGFTKGAIYSNFGGKKDLFAAVLQARSEGERTRLLAGAMGGPAEVAIAVAKIIAESITIDTQRGQLGLEFAARAARDIEVRQAWNLLRRTQREVAQRAICDVAHRNGLELTVEPAVAAVILHCLTNGLSMEHLADPDQVNPSAIARAVSATITALTVEKTAATHGR